MVQTWNLLIMLIPLTMGTCDQSAAVLNQGSSEENKVYLNKQEIELNDEGFQKLHTTLLELLNTCDDFYEQIVTNELVEEIKDREKYLEIYYAEETEINIANRQTMFIRKLFIPLSGKYRSNDEITFFCGIPEYSSEPYVNTKGFGKLDNLIRSLIDD